MSDRSDVARRAAPAWLWALAPLLLAAALVVPYLGSVVFDVDESATMISACMRHFGPCSPYEAVLASARWPENGWGHAVAFSQWGQWVGWSELAIRALPWFCGLLTLAWCYRHGRELFSPRVAWFATLLLSCSVVFLTYMHNVRPYGPATLFAIVALWAYWRVARREGPARRRDRAALLLGATGLLYSHYFGLSIIVALGLFHFLFLRKDRHWKQAVVLLCLAILLALPQAPDLLKGMAINEGREALHARAMHAPDVLSLFLRYLSNDLLNIRQPLVSMLLLAMPLNLVGAARIRRQRRQRLDACWYLAFTGMLSLLLIAGANELARVFDAVRIRYLAFLWPPAVLLGSQALLHPKRALLRPPFGVVLVLVISLAGVVDFRGEGPLVRTSWFWRDNNVSPSTIRELEKQLNEATPDSLLFVDERFLEKDRVSEAYFSIHPGPRELLGNEATSEELLRRALNHPEVFFLVRDHWEKEFNVQDHVEFFERHLWVRQPLQSRAGIVFVRLTSPFLNPLPDQRVLEFGQDIRLLGSGKLQENNLLRVVTLLHSADTGLLANYSLAMHVIDPRLGKRVAQGDAGIGPGASVVVQGAIDLAALPTGNYELHVALYDWQTGERLTARDLQTGEVSDMQVLERFHVD
ncbi:MAG: glycosyltransferase family 39 protein [Anaerolineaceae bacterium]|nr:glycosyltransferase family 39 protein [Anaerolineaceae bacterium]